MGFPAVKVPKLVYAASSPYNNRIEVFQVDDKYRLSVNNVVQSISHEFSSVKGRYWGQIVETVKEECFSAKQILMFGLGGATLPHLFKKALPDATITAIEIDEEMIKVAQQFFGLNELHNTKVIHADAMRVVSEPEKFDLYKGTFDVVIVDIFCGDNYPELGTSRTFLDGVKYFLKSDDGLAIFNRMSFGNHQFEAEEFVDQVKMLFKDVNTTAVAGRSNSDNILVYGRA